MTEQHECGSLAHDLANLLERDTGFGVSRNPAQCHSTFGGDAIKQVTVCGKVIAVGDDFGAGRIVAQLGIHGGTRKLVENDAG